MLLEAAAVTGRLPLPEPESAILRPALRLVGVVVRDQVVEVLEVLLEAVGDVLELLVTALDLVARGGGADRRAREDRVPAPVDRHADRDQHVRGPERDEGQDEPRNEAPVRAELSRRRRGWLSRHEMRRSPASFARQAPPSWEVWNPEGAFGCREMRRDDPHRGAERRSSRPPGRRSDAGKLRAAAPGVN